MFMPLPVLLITWRRPAESLKAYLHIIASSTTDIYIYNDGYCENPSVNSQIDQTKELIVNTSKQFPHIHHCFNFNEISSGCKDGVTNAISWFFSSVDEGIIIEDDIIMHPSFPEYCTYQKSLVPELSLVSAYSFPTRVSSSRLSRHAYIWGWFTNRNTWDRYRKNINEERVLSLLNRINDYDKRYHPYIHYICNQVRLVNKGLIDTWDYQLSFMMLDYNLYSVVPPRPLSTNIGFTQSATHTLFKPRHIKPLNYSNLEYDVNPISLCKVSDHYVYKTIYSPSILVKLIDKIYRVSSSITSKY